MVTDMRRETVGGTRDISGPAAFSFGSVLVLFGLCGFVAVGDGMLGLFRVTMSHNFFHLGVGAVLSAPPSSAPVKPGRPTSVPDCCSSVYPSPAWPA
jgi:hypothetical protein